MRNQKSKSNNTAKLVVLAILVLALALVLVSGIYARYISSASGSDTVRVAKWSFKIGENDIATTDTMTIDLFSTIKDSDGTSVENDVTGTKVIAPGTSGSFSLDALTNASEVTADYNVKFDVGTTAIPFEFSINGGDWTTAADVDISGTLAAGASTTSAVDVKWRWAFTNGTTANELAERDAADTALGVAQAAGTDTTATVTLTLTATQVD